MLISYYVKKFFYYIVHVATIKSLNEKYASRINEYDNDTIITAKNVYKTLQLIDSMMENIIAHDASLVHLKYLLEYNVSSQVILSLNEKKAIGTKYFICHLKNEKNDCELLNLLKYLKKNIFSREITINETQKCARIEEEVSILLDNLFFDSCDDSLNPRLYTLGQYLCNGHNINETFIVKNKKTGLHYLINPYKCALYFLINLVQSCLIHDIVVESSEI